MDSDSKDQEMREAQVKKELQPHEEHLKHPCLQQDAQLHDLVSASAEVQGIGNGWRSQSAGITFFLSRKCYGTV